MRRPDGRQVRGHHEAGLADPEFSALKKVRPRIAPGPDLTGARGTSARAAISSYVVTTTATGSSAAGSPARTVSALRGGHHGSVARPLSCVILAGVNDQSFFGEKLERAVPFRVNGVHKVAVNCRKHPNDRTHLMVVGCVIDLLANRKLRHRKLLLEFRKRSIRANWLTFR
jgi:hypothetical protein